MRRLADYTVGVVIVLVHLVMMSRTNERLRTGPQNLSRNLVARGRNVGSNLSDRSVSLDHPDRAGTGQPRGASRQQQPCVILIP